MASNGNGETNGVESQPYILAVDVGTTSLKCQVYNQQAEIVGKSSQKLKKIFPQRGYVELEPDALWEQIVSVVKDCFADSKLSADQITAMGISTLRATFITWNNFDDVAHVLIIIDWDNAKILDKEENKKTRWIKEAIWIRSRDSTMNREGGTYTLSNIFDPLLKTTQGATRTTSGNKTTSGQVSRYKTVGSKTKQAMIKTCATSSKLSARKTETGKPYHNFISWNDTRAANYCEDINGSVSLKFLRVGAKMIHTVNRGNRWAAASSFAFSTQHVILRLAWCLENVPGLRKDVNDGKVLFGCLDTWLVWKLTKGAVHATDLSNISATGLYDLFIGNWNSIHMSYLRIPTNILPEIRDTSDDYGCCDRGIFGAPIPIKGVISDQSGAIFGQCCFEEGDVKVTMGTGTFCSVNTHRPSVPGQGCWPLIGWKIGSEQMCILECNDSDTGGIMDWGVNMGFYTDVAKSESIAESVKDSGGVCFVPSFSGLQAPFENPTACCSFMGLTPATTPAHFVRAILESIAFRVKQLHDVVGERSKVKLKSVLHFDGGVSKNNFILNLISRLLQKDIDRPCNLDMSLLGAAFVAGLKAGIWKNKEELKALRKTQKLITPQKPCEEDSEMLEDWGRAIERSLSWYAITD